MATVKITRSHSLQARRLGRQDHVQLIPTPYPFQKAQSVRVTATWPVPPGPGKFFQKPRTETAVFNLPFMKAIEAAQRRWPGATITVKTINGVLTSPCAWCKKEEKESDMAPAGNGPDGKLRRVCKSHGDHLADLFKVDMVEAAS